MRQKIFFLLSLSLLLAAVGCSPSSKDVDSSTAVEEPQIADSTAPSPARSAPTEAVDDASIYVVEGPWFDQQGDAFDLASLRGQPVVISMIFTHCGHACPMLVSNMKEVQSTLPARLRNRVQFVLVSFDVEHDTADVLALYAENQRLDAQWTLLHGNEDNVRMLSMLLETQYALLDNGHFNHSNLITVLNTQGAIVQRFEGLEAQTDKVIEALKKADNR